MIRRPLSVFGIALLAFALPGAIGSASARHRSHADAGAPGDFAYYLLSLSWSPAFCLSSPGAAECNGPRLRAPATSDTGSIPQQTLS